jgi:hypothetical protein
MHCIFALTNLKTVLDGAVFCQTLNGHRIQALAGRFWVESVRFIHKIHNLVQLPVLEQQMGHAWIQLDGDGLARHPKLLPCRCPAGKITKLAGLIDFAKEQSSLNLVCALILTCRGRISGAEREHAGLNNRREKASRKPPGSRKVQWMARSTKQVHAEKGGWPAI